MKGKGFTLIELMIVVAIIAVIAAIAIPNLLKGKIASNEAAAIANLRTINSGQELYNARVGNYTATLLSLNTDGAYIDASLAKATAVGTLKSGYYYTYTVDGSNYNSWCCVATPSPWGTGGMRNFFISQVGSIHVTLTSGDTPDSTDKVLGE